MYHNCILEYGLQSIIELLFFISVYMIVLLSIFKRTFLNHYVMYNGFILLIENLLIISARYVNCSQPKQTKAALQSDVAN